MTSTNSQYLSVSSGHVDDLIKYVLDVKPYHTKLSQIVEEFLFTDSIDVKIADEHNILAFLGPDILSAVSPATGVRARRSKSWERDEISDGARRVFPVPLTISPKKSSHLSQDRFVSGQDDDTQIAGLNRGVFNQKRWDFSGVDTVLVNNSPKAEGVDYHLSYGVFSFVTASNQKWKPLNISDLQSIPGLSDDALSDRFDDSFALKFADQPGQLMYQDIIRSFGSITNVSGGNYEEWTLTCIETDVPTLEVKGSVSGIIGTINQDATFVHPLISFEFKKTPGETVETISLGQIFVLTPFGRVVVHPDAPAEIWSLIKTNPHVLVTAPVYTRGGTAMSHPGVQVHTRNMEHLPPSTWSIVVGVGGQYVIDVVTELGFDPIQGYPKTVSLVDGCSYKDKHVHFTLLPTPDGFHPGDRIDFTIKPHITNYLVYGSVSGWQPPAKVGQYYWNGKIGFKIPELRYFARSYNTTIITSPNADSGSWATVVSNPQILNSVSHVNGSFIVAGEDSIVGRSLDGYAWSSEMSGLANTGQLYVVVGDKGKIVTSPDGDAWTPRASHTNQNLKAVSYIRDFLTAPVIEQYSSSATSSTISFSTITALQSGANRNFLVKKNGSYVDDAFISVVSLTSVEIAGLSVGDTVEMTVYDSAIGDVNSILVVGDRGTILSSVNGVGWAVRNSGTLDNLKDIAWSNDGIFVVGTNGTLLKSVDRVTWTPVAISIAEFPEGIVRDLNAITYVAAINTFVIVGGAGTVLLSTDGGMSWVRPALPSDFDRELNAIAYGEGRFVAVGQGGFTITSDTGGLVWTGYESAKLNDIAYGDGVFVAVGGKRGDNTLFIPNPNKRINSTAVPSVYTITFQAPSVTSTAGAMTATVQHNLSGFKRGLVVVDGTESPDEGWWEDEHVSFKISTGGGQVTYLPGDTIKVHLAPSHVIPVRNGYDVVSYDDTLYDIAIADVEVPTLFNEEIYPLYHSHGSVIIPNISTGDVATINKAYKDDVRLKIQGAGLYFRELAAVDDWIPLEFRYFDRVVAGIPTSNNGEFDLATHIEAYLAADPSVKVFSISQPRFAKTDRPASAVLTFDQSFFKNYIKFNTRFTLRFHPAGSWGEKIRVKVSENFTTYAKILLNFDDILRVSISDTIDTWDIITNIDVIDSVNVQFVEGGALPFGGYDVLPFDSFFYDRLVRGEYVTGIIENPPGSGNYEYTGNDADWIRPKTVTGGPGIQINEDSPGEVTGTAFVEGLTIVERNTAAPSVIARLSAVYDVDVHTALGGLRINEEATEYLITHNYSGSTPTLIVESDSNPGVFMNPIPNTTPYEGSPSAISFKSFSFSVPPGTAPFKLILS